MREIVMGEPVKLAGKVVYLPDLSRTIENQAVTVQLKDGQGVQTNIRNIERLDTEAVAKAEAEAEAKLQEQINALLQEQEGQHQARLVQLQQEHQREVTSLKAHIEALNAGGNEVKAIAEALQADRDELKATAEAFADRIKLLEAQIADSATKALTPATETEPEPEPGSKPEPTAPKKGK